MLSVIVRLALFDIFQYLACVFSYIFYGYWVKNFAFLLISFHGPMGLHMASFPKMKIPNLLQTSPWVYMAGSTVYTLI